ncbi:hypothetical protein FZEAL_3452, partial [Fusarium zealandicum]
VDYPGPFNPRGDGHLKSSSGSPGSGSAVASYVWLDFSLGTDSLAGVKAQAAVHSVFGMRPTRAAISTQGLVTYSPHWDTVSGLARTAAEFKLLTEALYSTPGAVNREFEIISPCKAQKAKSSLNPLSPT